ncbi:AraC family transcriptional regulator [Paenibacillus sp. HB172176]|uniref:AraC family transcriptional regulator n=1 Tax=Paenibacillus sp. HB172176 TaxID=2493690 RepID=UPI00143C8509|nr:AraC family transcriptional regulator [Paenibacillus sp. HB172176]
MRGARLLKIRFFMSLTLISICSVLVLASALFVWFRGKTIENVNQVNESVLQNTETVFAKYIELAQNYTMDFYRNPNINTVMQSGDNSWSDQLYSALSQIKGTLTVNPFLENAYIMGQAGPVLMFENNPLDASTKQDLYERVRDSVIKQSPYLWTATLNNGDKQNLMTVFYNDRAFDSSEYIGAIAMTINPRKLQENVFGSGGDDNTRYGVLSADGDVLMQSGAAGATFEPAMLEKIIGGSENSGTLVWKPDNGDKKLITYRKAKLVGLWFLSETSYRDSIRDISNALTFIIVICLALIAAASGIAAFVSHRMYKPIGTLFGNIRNLTGDAAPFAQNGGFDEANRELERIAGRFGELKRENEDSALLRWLTSPYHSGEHLPSALPSKNMSSGETFFCVAAMGLQRLNEENGLSDEEWMQKMRGLPQEMERLFNGKAACRGYFPHSEAAVLIVSETEAGSFGEDGLSRDLWEQLVEAMQAWPVASCSIGVSRLSADSKLLKELYDEANDCMRHLKFQPRASIILMEDTLHLKDSAISDSSLNAVLQSVKNGEYELIPPAIEDFLEAAGGFQVKQATIAVARLASELGKIGETRLPNPAAPHSDFLEWYQRIWLISDFEALQQWLEQLSLDACERLKEMNTAETRDIAGEAMAYIRKNFSDPSLSLNGLAEMLAISPPYLSRLITEATDSSFPEFIHLVRLEHARELLATNAELDIKSVAEQCGYSSSTYFTTLFRKRYGVTPSKWRLNHILQKSD